MAVTAALYDAFLANALGSTVATGVPNVDWLSDAQHCTLHTSLYAVSKTAHDFVDDLTNEITGTGYTAGGVVLANKTLAITSSVIVGDADDAVWAASTLTARFAVVSDRTPATAATQPLIGYQNFGADVSSSGGEYRVAWSANGIFRITVAAEA